MTKFQMRRSISKRFFEHAHKKLYSAKFYLFKLKIRCITNGLNRTLMSSVEAVLGI